MRAAETARPSQDPTGCRHGVAQAVTLLSLAQMVLYPTIYHLCFELSSTMQWTQKVSWKKHGNVQGGGTSRLMKHAEAGLR